MEDAAGAVEETAKSAVDATGGVMCGGVMCARGVSKTITAPAGFGFGKKFNGAF